MNKFLKNGLMFLILFFIIEKGTYFFMIKTPNREYDKRLENVINGNMNKDLIVLGSSIGGGNIIAGQIEKQTGYSSYNLSYQGSNILFHEFVLKSLLKFNKPPKKIILSIDNPYEFIEEVTLKFRFDRLYPLSQYNYINNELIAHNERTILSKLFCVARLRISDFNTVKVNAPTLNPIAKCGSIPIIKLESRDFNYLNTVYNYNIKNEEPEKIVAFKNIQSLCEANNIELIFVFSPYYRNFNAGLYNRFKKLVKPENKVFVFDTLNPIYKNKDYYYDVSHLMKNGAEIFTSEISSFINKNSD